MHLLSLSLYRTHEAQQCDRENMRLDVNVYAFVIEPVRPILLERKKERDESSFCALLFMFAQLNAKRVHKLHRTQAK